MRIAMLMDKPLPAERATGIGVGGYELARALAGQGVNVTLICRGVREKVLQFGPLFSIRTVPHYTFKHSFELAGLFHRGTYDLVHTHSLSTLPGCVITKLFAKPVVMHAVGWMGHSKSERTTARSLRRELLCEMSDRIFAISQFVMTGYPRRYRDKMSVIYNGVDTEFFRPLTPNSETASKYNLPSTGRIILTVGAVQNRKGQHLVIRTMERLARLFPKVVFVNVGSASSSFQLEQLTSLADKVAPGRVFFLTNVSRQDLPQLINLADVCVQASQVESFGLAIVEEMSCGKPVIAFRNSSMPELIDSDEDGILVETGTVERLGDAIISVLIDTPLATRLGEQARLKVLEKFTWEKTAREVISAYETLF